jgi:biotin carboxylase
MKKLMIIGASVLQLPAILKAKEMGLHVAVVDFNPQAIGIQYADKYYNASTMDENAVLAAAGDYQPDGIMTLATDMPMRGVAKVAEKLGLPGISYDTALKATDKFEMIKAFKAYDVASPWFFTVDSIEELKALEGQLTYPCIMKPTDNAGSHGVVLAKSFDDVLREYDYSRENARHGKVIIEEYLKGDEVSVEVMVVDGKVNILQITDKLTTGAPHFVEMGHSQPSRHPLATQKAIKELATKACQAVGINRGPAHVEMMVTERGPVMIELGARMGGDNITTALVPLSTGIDMVKATIDVALGNQPDIEPSLHCASAIRYIAAPEGIITSIDGVEEAKQLSGVKEVIMTKAEGEMSTPIHCSNDRIGSVIVQAATAEEAVRICEKALKQIIIEIK